MAIAQANKQKREGIFARERRAFLLLTDHAAPAYRRRGMIAPENTLLACFLEEPDLGARSSAPGAFRMRHLPRHSARQVERPFWPASRMVRRAVKDRRNQPPGRKHR
jgi:hypothetical protein